MPPDPAPGPGADASDGESLADMVERARAGDREALARLFELHEPMMLRWARRRLGQPLRSLDETRDILHDAYHVVLKKIGTFVPEDRRSFARWLRGIITRVVLRKAGNPYIKKRELLSTRHHPQDLELTPHSRLSVEDLLSYRYRLLREFPRGDRRIYRLRIRGWSSAEIADALGVTDRAVRLRFAQTDARIRVRMKRFVEGRDDP